MSKLTQLYLLTYNCNKILDNGFVQQMSHTFPKEIPSCLLFALEEVCSIQDSTNADVVNKYLIAINDLILSSLKEHYDVEFKNVAIHHVGAIGLILITPFRSKIKKIKTGKYSCGITFTSLKGGCGIRFTYENQEFTIVAAHLNAGEGSNNWDRRDKDAQRLLSSIDFGDGYGVIKPDNHIFFMGDLNYRLIKNNSIERSESNELLLTEYDTDKDELQTSIKRSSAFWGFKELPITFNPSYKFYNNTTEYNPKRLPSWCDRILFLDYKKNKINLNNYNIVPNVLTSDHHPVFLDIQVPLDPPKIKLIDSQGYLLDDTSIYMKPSLSSKLLSSLTVIADFTIFGSLYLVLTNKGRMILGLIGLLIAAELFF